MLHIITTCPTDSLKCPIVIVAMAVHHIKISPWSACNGPVPTVTDTPVKITGEELFKVEIHLEHVLDREREVGVPITWYI